MPKGVEGPDVSILFGQIQVRDNPPSAEVMPEDFPDTEPPTVGEIGMGTPNGLEIDRDLDSQIAAFERGVPAFENQQTLLPPGSNPTACHYRLGQQPTDAGPFNAAFHSTGIEMPLGPQPVGLIASAEPASQVPIVVRPELVAQRSQSSQVQACVGSTERIKGPSH